MWLLVETEQLLCSPAPSGMFISVNHLTWCLLAANQGSVSVPHATLLFPSVFSSEPRPA